jgi:hypothetical protein
MNDLDAFRATLQTPGVTDDKAIDIGQIMKQGGRLRRRRRLATGGIGVATALVLVVGGVQVSRSFGPPSPNPGAPFAAAPSTPPSGPAAIDPSPGDGTRTPLGAVVRTGMSGVGGEIVLYMVRVEEAQLPEIPFGLMVGIREATGEADGKIISNETEGSATAEGFHAVQGAMNVDSQDFPLFGYYVGPAKKIKSGKLVAKQKPWSEDPSVIIFWFDPSDTPPNFEGKSLTAYDAKGEKLPTGNRSVGVG